MQEHPQPSEKISVNRHVWLIGLRDTIRKQVALELSRHILNGRSDDINDRVVQASGFEIPKILTMIGWDHTLRLRKAEEAAKIAGGVGYSVVSTGSITTYSPEDISRMNRSGITVAIHMPLIIRALSLWFQDRMDTSVLPPPGLLLRHIARLQKQESEMKQLLNECKIHVHSSGLSKNAIVREVLKQLAV